MKRRPLLASIAAVLALVATALTGAESASAAPSCVGAAAHVNLCASRYQVPAGLDVAAAARDTGSLTKPCTAKSTAIVMCTFGDSKTFTRSIAVVGNSHAGHLIGGLDAYGKKNHIRVVLMRKTGCSGAVEKAVGWSAGSHQGCFTWTHNVMQKVRSWKAIDAVVFASNNNSLRYIDSLSASKATRAKVTSAIQSTLSSLKRANKAVLVFGDTPGYYPYAVPACVQSHRTQYDPCARPASIGDERGNYVAHAAKLTRGVIYRSLTKYFCDAKRCHVVIGGQIAYVDEHHLTNTFSTSLAPYLGTSVALAIRSR